MDAMTTSTARQRETKIMQSNVSIKKTIFIIFIMLAFIGTALAIEKSSHKMASSKKLIPNLKQSIKTTQTKINLPIVFPKKIPANAKIKPYYAFIEMTKNSYIIYVDSTKTCQGAHVCNIGSVKASKNGKIGTYYDMNKKKITVPVKLKHHVTGYFTPSHAMGDFWPAIIQWQKNKTVYSISWNMKQARERAALIYMANEMIKGDAVD